MLNKRRSYDEDIHFNKRFAELRCWDITIRPKVALQGHQRKVAQIAPAGDLKKIVKPLWQWIIFSIARVYAGSSGVALRNFTMVAHFSNGHVSHYCNTCRRWAGNTLT